MEYIISSFSSKFIVSGCHVRCFANINSGRKTYNDYGTVNKKGKKELVKEEPNLTIYPFSIDDLTNPSVITESVKATNKIDKSIENVLNDNPKKIAQIVKPTDTYKKAEEIVKYKKY